MVWTTLADLTLVATTGILGRDATYTPAGGAAESVQGIFEAEAEDVLMSSEGVPIVSTAPYISFRIADLSQTPVADDTVVVDSVTYDIDVVRIDGEGGVRCKLLVA